MNKLLSVIVAALFAVSTTAFVASPVGAQTKGEDKKMEKEKKSAKGEKKSAPKKEGKADKKKSTAAPKKGEGKKKDEMKK